jgi:hypothetical protein
VVKAASTVLSQNRLVNERPAEIRDVLKSGRFTLKFLKEHATILYDEKDSETIERQIF